MKNLTKSRELYEYAKSFMAGGVHSNFRFFYPHPIYFAKGKGSKIWDADENQYIDCVVNYGACILGHGHPKIVEAVKNQLETGLTVGVETELSVEVSKKLIKLVPSAEAVRFANSGTEAVMHSIMIARGYTGKDKIIKIEGGYNGWYPDVLVSTHPDLELAGPIDSLRPVPCSGGLPSNVATNTMIIPFNNVEVAERMIKKYRKEIAALIMEPVMFNIGCALPKKGYLQSIRELTEENDIPLIFDEVITGFRLAPGGAQQYYKVKPDLTVFAKALANGFPLGAVVGREDIMKVVDPTVGKVMYGGTYNGNQISIAAVTVTLEELGKGDIQKNLNDTVGEMIKRFQEIVQDNNVSARMQGIGGEFQVYFTDHEVTDYRTACTTDEEKFLNFQKGMLKQNILMLPKYLFHHGITVAHKREDIEAIMTAVEKTITQQI